MPWRGDNDRMDSLVKPSRFLRAKAEALGEVGTDWLSALPTTIASLERLWNVRVVSILEGGTASHVLRVTTAEGRDAILKLGLPGTGFVSEVTTLLIADGHGYVRVLASDPERSASLLEPLGHSLSRSDLDPDGQLAVLGKLIALSRISVANSHAFEVHDKAAELGTAIAEFRQTLDHGCDDVVFETCALYASRLSDSFAHVSPVLLHGDAAAANVLEVIDPRPGAELGWVFVDPEPFLGDPTYDLGVAARDWCDELLAAGTGASELLRHYCEVLAQASGTDARQIWEWAYLERVSTGLFVLSFGAKDFARPFFESAELVLT